MEGGGDNTYTFPAEFEPQECVWLSWPRDPTEMLAGRPFAPVLLDMIESLQPHVKVAVIVNTKDEEQIIREALLQRQASSSSSSSSSSNGENDLAFHLVKHDSIWMRDFGPIFLKSQNVDASQPLKVVDFRWSVWGYADGLRPIMPPDEFAEMIDSDGGVARRVAGALSLATVDATDFVSEGGDREFNGRGTLMVTEAVQLQRNPHLTRDQLTDRFKSVFNVRKVIWLKQGVAEDDQIFNGPLPGGVFTMPCTGGHIDEYARFVSPTTILLAEVREEDRDHPIGRISHERLEENYRILAGETDQDGNPFTIIRIPLPPIDIVTVKPTDRLYAEYGAITFRDGRTFEQIVAERRRERGLDDAAPVEVEAVVPGSYCNFLISNGVVLMPRYYGEGRPAAVKRTDDAAREIMQAAFPAHKIVQIDCENVNFGGGGMHCISQQQPRTSWEQ